jgi:hypothetical protein
MLKNITILQLVHNIILSSLESKVTQRLSLKISGKARNQHGRYAQGSKVSTMRSSGYIISALTFVNSALAWGELGHRTVAYIAYSQLTEPTRKYVDNVLALKKGEDISDIAIWADAVRREKKYSAPWHYIGRGKLSYFNVSKNTC